MHAAKKYSNIFLSGADSDVLVIGLFLELLVVLLGASCDVNLL